MLNDNHTLETMLEALADATLSIAQTDDLNMILQQIADICRSITTARVATLGIFDEHGTLQKIVVSDPANSNNNAAAPPHSSDLLKAIIQKNNTIRIDHTDSSSINFDFPPNLPQPDSFIGAPIIADNITGAIYLADKKNGASFTIADEKVVEIIATHTAVAIRSERLQKTREKNQRELELRNAQLAALNEAALAIAAELSLDKVLQQIVDSARNLLQAEYAALGVPNSDGYLETFIHSGMNKEIALKIEHLPKGFGLLGALYAEQKTIRIPKISADTRSVGFPDNHPPMDSFLGVPIIAGSETLGNLYLTNKLNAPEFGQEDQDMAELLAAHAAIAIQNAHLYEQVGRLAIVEERTRIGMDLHDGIIQSIYAVGLTLETSRLALPPGTSDADKMLSTAINGLNDTIRDIRNFILDLRPHRFSGNLRQGLSRLIREFQANTMVLVTLKAPDEAFKSIPTSIARAIFLTTQEALANVARHARASEVYILVDRNHSEIKMTIKDDGQGFDIKKSQHRIGHGLSNMQARMEELRGSFDLHSVPGEGTSITLILPLY